MRRRCVICDEVQKLEKGRLCNSCCRTAERFRAYTVAEWERQMWKARVKVRRLQYVAGIPMEGLGDGKAE